MTATEQAIADLRDVIGRLKADREIDMSVFLKELRLSVGLVEGWQELHQEFYKQAGYH